MRCPFCSQNIRLQGKFCPKCGKQIFGLPVQRPEDGALGAEPRTSPPPPSPTVPLPPPPVPRPPTPPDLFSPDPTPSYSHDDDTLDIELGPVETPRPGVWSPPQAPNKPLPSGPVGTVIASGEEIGKTCPYCRFPIKIGESIVVCDACKSPHHADCWQENGGCTSYGCARAPGARPQPVATAGGYPSAGGAAYPRSNAATVVGGMMEGIVLGEIERSANNALAYAIVGWLCCPIIPSIAGLLMGLSVLSSISRLGVNAPGPRGKAIAAIILGALEPLVVIISMVASSSHSVGPYGR